MTPSPQVRGVLALIRRDIKRRFGSTTEAARRLGLTRQLLEYRLSGRQEIRISNLEEIAEVFGGRLEVRFVRGDDAVEREERVTLRGPPSEYET